MDERGPEERKADAREPGEPTVPASAAIATHPAGERNKHAIADVLRSRLCEGERVLEIASGPGQHVELLASQLPYVQFQPSEPDPRMRASILARTAVLANVASPLPIAAQEPWPRDAFDAVLAINLVHIVSEAITLRLLHQAAAVLRGGGLLYLYGPYRVGGHHVSAGNADFDRTLRERDPQSGIRDVEWVSDQAGVAGFDLPERVAMPANNLSLLFRRRDTNSG